MQQDNSPPPWIRRANFLEKLSEDEIEMLREKMRSDLARLQIAYPNLRTVPESFPSS